MSASHQGVHTVHLSLEARPGPLDLLHQQREVELVPVVRTVKMSLDIFGANISKNKILLGKLLGLVRKLLRNIILDGNIF